MRNELMAWFAREGLLLSSVSVGAEDPQDEVKITMKPPLVALSRASADFRECPDPVLFGYPDASLEMMELQDMHEFVLDWFGQAVAHGKARCFVCNRELDTGTEKPWDAVFVTSDICCWLVVHFDCKRYLNRDIKGRHPFEITAPPPEFFDMRLGPA